jgi:general secretion pathway protein L
MKIVGLNIEPGRFAATVVQRQFGRTEVLDSVVRSWTDEEGLVGALRELAPQWAGARIVSALPGRVFTQRSLTFPFGDRKRIEKALTFEVEDAVPFELDQVALGHLLLGRPGTKKGEETHVLCLMVPRAELGRHLELLSRAGIDPQAVVPSFAGLAALAARMPANGPALLVMGQDLCLAEGSVVKALRSRGSTATGGLLHVLRSIETEQRAPVEKAVLLSDDAPLKQALEELGLAVEVVSPEIGGQRPSDPGSLGIALTEEVNLRTGEFAYRKEDEGLRRRRRTVIIAASAVALLFAVNVGVKYFVVRSGYGNLERQINDIFRQTFPDARSTGDPVREMRDKLNDAKKRFGALGSGTSALDVMRAVTDGIPVEMRVTFQDFLLEGERLRLQGEAPSFESLDKIKSQLQKSPLFSDVQVQDTHMGVDNKVKFRFDIKLKQAM